MRTPAYGLVYSLWLRYRILFVGLTAYLALLALLLQVSPSLLEGERIILATLPALMGLVCLIGVLTQAESDVSSRESEFPPSLLLLPVRTRDLVALPMLGGGGVIALTWIALAEIYRAAGMAAPVGWPAAMLAAMLACLQALSWFPMAFPYLRMILLMVIMPGLLFFGLFGVMNDVSAFPITLSYLGVIPVAFLFAEGGVSLTRRGGSGPWRSGFAKNPSITSTTVKPSRPFDSPGQAQLWLEWKRNGWILALIVLCYCALFNMPLFWVHENTPWRSMMPPPGGENLQVNISMIYAQFMPIFPPFFALIVGCGLRKSEMRRKDFSLHPFLATRPISSLDLIKAKLWMAFYSTLLAWAVVLVFVAFWMFLPAQDANSGVERSLGYLLYQHLTLRGAGLMALILFGLVMLTWRNQVQWIFADLSGQSRWVLGYPLVQAALAVVYIGHFLWLSMNPESMPTLLRLLPWIGGGAALAKLALGTGMLIRLQERSILKWDVLARLGAVWLLMATSLVLLMRWLLPEGTLLPWSMVMIAILSLPLARLAAAPLMVEQNRHG